jgi:ketosteroid isomerase-like protein
MPDQIPELVEAVQAANQAYYEAFEGRDLDAMSDVWHHDDDVVCTHPGWKTLHGWGAVAGSWFALFGGPQHLQVILTDEKVHLSGDVASGRASPTARSPSRSSAPS